MAFFSSMNIVASGLTAQQMRLDVVSTNDKAQRLYEKLGFIRTAEKRRWHRVFPLEA